MKGLMLGRTYPHEKLMVKKLDDILAVLPVKRNAKIERRAMELPTHNDLRQVADQSVARALSEEQAALAVKAWNNLHDEGGSFADGHATL